MSEPYEFDAEQNKTIENLARSMLTVGLVMMVFGVVGIAGIVIAFITNKTNNLTLGSILESVFLVLFGYWTRNAGHAFDAVVKTKGSDIPHLMSALGDLSKMYGLVRNIILFCICVFLAFSFVMLVLAPLFAHR